MTEDAQKAAVYVAWTTFKNAVDQLVQGVPNVIDRTVFPGLSGGVQSQLFAGMRFLGLISDKSVPLPSLRELAVPDEAVRKVKLKEILQQSYGHLFALDLEKTTPGQLLEQMRTSYQVSGDTADKAMRFFLSAVEYVGVPVSPLFKTSKPANGNGGAPVTRRKGRKPKTPKIDPLVTPAPQPENPTPAGESRSVTLRSGGTLTISASTGFLSLSSVDRTFVFGLIDKLEEYEKNSSQDKQE